LSFQTPVPVEDMLSGIHHKKYLLPAIQREFVWDADQVRRLVDSLMRGYPIGSFLVWKVEPDTAREYTFYDFLTDYHERDNPFASKAVVPAGHGVLAILDGQQRLTALNIAVYGSLAVKKKYAWWNGTDAFPKKRLYLNLLDDPDPDELGLRYDLRFLTHEEAQAKSGEPDRWLPLLRVLSVEDTGPAMTAELANRGVPAEHSTAAHHRLNELHSALRVVKAINYYLEVSQDPDKVLDIFVRVNSGGTTLSYSDLLLSMAVNQFKRLDAREEVRGLVQQLNTGSSREFYFSKDVVLKTALLVAGVDPRFRITNFTRDNMAKVETRWDETRGSLVRAATLLDTFGFTGRTLTADSVLIPVAYYLHRRGASDGYLETQSEAKDRLLVRKWVVRSLIKRGIWASNTDTLLTRVRRAIDEHGKQAFPIGEIETVMADPSLGKSLRFDATELDELLQLKYGGQRTFSVLSLLYPGLDFSKEFHEDHLFPRARFTSKRLGDAGVPPAQINAYQAAVDCLPNLQLLGGLPNKEKNEKLPGEWLEAAFGSSEQRETYVRDNDLNGLPLDIAAFLEFFEKRRAQMRKRLSALLDVEIPPEAPA
jgi:Protein of unknown function DUF262